MDAITHVIESVHEKHSTTKFVLIIFGGKGTPMDKHLIREFSQVMADNYPEKLHKGKRSLSVAFHQTYDVAAAIIFPGSKLAHAIWGVTKWFFHRNTREKVLIMPTHKPKAYDIFRDMIPAKSLHKKFGGERPDEETLL